MDTTEAAERGAALLDVEFPGWETRIDLDRLDMYSVYDCILGQLYDEFASGLDDLFGDECDFDAAVEYGFDTDTFNMRGLLYAWKAEIAERLD